MNPEDEEPTAEELREAEALARALDGGHAAPDVPDDALETAALLRHANDGGTLAPERARDLLEDAIRRARPARSRAAFRWRLFGVLGLGAAAAGVALLLRSGPVSTAAKLPPPPRALLEAELDAARSPPSRPDALDDQMRAYRGVVYASLEEHYRR
jgi:hypothetical protein